MKRILAMVLVALLIAGLMPAAYAESTAVQKVASGRMRNGFRWTFDPSDGVLTIYGNGEMPDMSEPVPWEAYRDQIVMIIICDGIKSISDRCFAGIPNLESVLISPTVAKAGSNLFDGCKKLSFIGYEGDLETLRNILSKNDISNVEMGNYTVTQDESGQIVYKLPDGKTFVLEDGTKVTKLDNGDVQNEYTVGDIPVVHIIHDNDEETFIFTTVIPPTDSIFDIYLPVFKENEQQTNNITIRCNKKGEILYYSEKSGDLFLEPTIVSGKLTIEQISDNKFKINKVNITTSEGVTLDLDLSDLKPIRQTVTNDAYVEEQKYEDGRIVYDKMSFTDPLLETVTSVEMKKTGNTSSEVTYFFVNGNRKTFYQNDKDGYSEKEILFLSNNANIDQKITYYDKSGKTTEVVNVFRDDSEYPYKTYKEEYKNDNVQKEIYEFKEGYSYGKVTIDYEENGERTSYYDGNIKLIKETMVMSSKKIETYYENEVKTKEVTYVNEVKTKEVFYDNEGNVINTIDYTTGSNGVNSGSGSAQLL